MKQNISTTSDLSKVLVRYTVVLFLLTVLRIVFYLFNHSEFESAGIADFLAGICCDTITLCLYLLPYVFFQLFPFKFDWLNKLSSLYFHACSIWLFFINTVDIEYYRYTSKRSTFDFFQAISTGNDFNQLWTTFLMDFWIITLLFLVVLYAHFKLIKYFTENLTYRPFIRWETRLIAFIVPTIVVFFVARGGIFRKPFSTVDLVQLTSPEKTALVANSGFTVLKSFGKADLEQKSYFSATQLDQLFNPVQQSEPQNILTDKPNVVFIVLESFGIEFVGKYSEATSYTPFLDSLIDQSLWFEYAYANGMKSNEAIPAIVSSIPSLMNTPYLSSPYATNKEHGLTEILGEHGYSTAFYHGATNGSMNFDSYSKKTGFQYYFGRKEYSNDKHFDGYWGISDEYFNPWAAKKMSQLKAPFFALLFTISSHHPYYIPEHLQKNIKQGPQPICASVNYGDYSLRKFFEEAKKQAWFKNTIFVLCADHTPATTSRLYKHHTIRYRIPILFYDPSGRLPKGKKTEVFQQLDIMPTTLDLLNIKTKYYAFGQSYFSKKPKAAISFLQDNYYYFVDNWMLTYNGNQLSTNRLNNIKNVLRNNEDIDKKMLSSYKNRLKAIVQRYNNDMLNNHITTK